MNRQKKNAAAVSASKARLKKLDERHLNFAESDRFNFHGVVRGTKFLIESQLSAV